MRNITPHPAANSRSNLHPTLTCVALSCLVLSAASPVSGEELNRIVLRVNEEILTLHEYEARKATEISNTLANPRIDSAQRQERLEQIGQMVVQNSFSEMLLLSFANQHSIRIGDAEVQQSVQDLMQRQGIETNEQMQQALAANDMTLEQLHDNARRELLWQQVVGREVQPKVVISDEELRAYYRNNKEEFRTPEQRWLKEIIVLEDSGLSDEELRRTATEIRQQLMSGSPAEEVIAPYKEREVTTGWIDLEWLQADELETSLSETAWALAPGEYSEPVAARGGLHILHVAGLRESTVKPLDEVGDLIRRREYNSRFNRQLGVFLKELEDQAYIQEDLPPEAVGYQALAPDYEAEDELELFRAPIDESAEGAGGGNRGDGSRGDVSPGAGSTGTSE
ncbi:MAG: peptidyl-prolyl cis-trans isomerase [Acidobacteriota bacterium]